MNKLNNKGQSLFLFIIFIPIFIMLCAFVVDIGIAKVTSNKLDDLSKMVLNYGLKHINDNPYDEIINLINKNDSNIEKYDLKIDEVNRKIDIVLTKNTNGYFSSIVGKNIMYQVILLDTLMKTDHLLLKGW